MPPVLTTRPVWLPPARERESTFWGQCPQQCIGQIKGEKNYLFHPERSILHLLVHVDMNSKSYCDNDCGQPLSKRMNFKGRPLGQTLLVVVVLVTLLVLVAPPVHTLPSLWRLVHAVSALPSHRQAFHMLDPSIKHKSQLDFGLVPVATWQDDQGDKTRQDTCYWCSPSSRAPSCSSCSSPRRGWPPAATWSASWIYNI